MFKSTLRLLSLIVLPHPELPPSYTEANRHPKWKREDFCSVNHLASPLLVDRTASANMTTTPRKAPRPISLDAPASAAQSSAISRRRHSLCVCPEHCPPRDISPSETFWTCPAFPDSAVSPLNLLGTYPNSNDNNLELTPTPRWSRSLISHELESPSTSFPDTSLFKEFRGDDSSPRPLTLRRNFRRDSKVMVSTPSTSIAMTAQTSLDELHETPPTSPSCERIGNKRHSEGSSQTYSKLFELELSPILEDSHGADVYFGPVVDEREGSIHEASSSYSETSDSSFGEPLQYQTTGSIKFSATHSDPTYPQVGLASNEGLCYASSVPALTITSPTPETLQSVVFSDSSAPKVQEHDARSRSMTPSNERPSSSGFLSPIRSSGEHWHKTEVRDFLTVPVKDHGKNRCSGNAKIEQEKPEKPKVPILSKAWKRLSRVLVLSQKVTAQETEKVAFRRKFQRNGTRRSMSTESRDVTIAQASSGVATGTDPKERLSRIMVRRRTAKRHGKFKRYSVPF